MEGRNYQDGVHERRVEISRRDEPGDGGAPRTGTFLRIVSDFIKCRGTGPYNTSGVHTDGSQCDHCEHPRTDWNGMIRKDQWVDDTGLGEARQESSVPCLEGAVPGASTKPGSQFALPTTNYNASVAASGRRTTRDPTVMVKASEGCPKRDRRDINVIGGQEQVALLEGALVWRDDSMEQYIARFRRLRCGDVQGWVKVTNPASQIPPRIRPSLAPSLAVVQIRYFQGGNLV